MPDNPLSSRIPRGIHNLGATCFLSVILQSFIHNPILRNFFLADRHNQALCASSTGEACMACEMDKLFTDVSGAFARRQNQIMARQRHSLTPHLRLRSVLLL